MAQETPRRRRGKKRPGTEERPPPSSPPPAKKKTSGLVKFLIILALAGGGTGIVLSQQKGGEDFETAPMFVLDQLFMGCKVFWYEVGPGTPCGQEQADLMFGGPKHVDIEITVDDGGMNSFTAQAKHRGNGKVFQVDDDGVVYFKHNECLVELKDFNLSLSDVEEMEARCMAT